MPHHIIDLTSTPAVTPVPPRPQPSISQPTLPAGKHLPSTDASATRSIPSNGAPAGKRLPSNGQPALNEAEALQAKRELLADIIKDCKKARLRTVLRDLMAKNGHVAVDWIGDALLVREEAVKPFVEGDDDMGNSDLEIPEESDEESNEDDNEDNDEDEEENSDEGGRTTAPRAKTSATTTANASAGMKRLRARYARCINCEEEFDTTSNEPGECIWHEGEMEVDWDGDFWADHDEDCHGPIDEESNRKEYPEGFIWTCCDKNGEEEGCKIGRHREEPETVKRLRMMP